VALKRPEREADHSASAGDKTEWSYTSTPLYAFMEGTGTIDPVKQ